MLPTVSVPAATSRTNAIIGALSGLAGILAIAAVAVHHSPELTMASGMTVSGGDYIITVGRHATVDEELVYIIDAASEKLIAYRFDGNRQQIEIVQGMDLGELRGSAHAPGKQPPPRPGPKSRP